MKYSKKIIHFVENLVSEHAKFDRYNNCYSLCVNDLSDFDQHELAALIMATDNRYANEAIGCDNPHYEKTMLPALLKYMGNSTNKDEEIEFKNAWINGVTSYFNTTIQELLDDACNDHFHSTRNETYKSVSHNKTNDEIYWN